VNIAELLTEGRAVLAQDPELPDPGREARWLMARVLGQSEAWVLSHPEATLTEAEATQFHDWVRRRAAGEPAHYIVGVCPFWGREFVVTRTVLIPRPETELIVERALTLPLPASPRILDVGTGSGNVAVTLALEVPGAQVTATDVSLAAVTVAQLNAARHGGAVLLSCGDLAEHVNSRFDLVTANLPYIPSGTVKGLLPEVRDHEPHVALAGGPDGMELIRKLLSDLPRLLRPGGYALLEVGPVQAWWLEAAVAESGLEEVDRISDAGHVERTLVLRWPEARE